MELDHEGSFLICSFFLAQQEEYSRFSAYFSGTDILRTAHSRYRVGRALEQAHLPFSTSISLNIIKLFYTHRHCICVTGPCAKNNNFCLIFWSFFQAGRQPLSLFPLQDVFVEPKAEPPKGCFCPFCSSIISSKEWWLCLRGKKEKMGLAGETSANLVCAAAGQMTFAKP